jgi:hypothetical protein
VVPGFIDSRVHFIPGGLQVLYIQTHSLNDSMFFSFLRVVIFHLKSALVYVRICFKCLRVIEIIISV